MRKNKIHTPHDRFFRTSLSDSKTAKQFFLQYLPKGIRKMINLDSLQFKNETFVDEKLEKQETDMLFSADFKGEPGYIYLLIEHESSVERLMPLRLLKYMISIMEDHLKKTKEKDLPLIYPMIFYTGRKPYHASTDLFDLFGQKKELGKKVLMNPYRLINVNDISDERLNKFLLAGMMAKVMKHSRDKDIFPFIKINIKNLQTLEKQEGKAYNETIILYLLEAGEAKNKEKLLKFITDNLSEEALGDKVMTIAQQFRDEGRKMGKQEALEETQAIAERFRDEGEVKGKIKAFEEITALLKQGLSIEEILERIQSSAEGSNKA